MNDEPDLDKAYALKTPDDNIELYRDWAATYDSDFAEDTGYQLPHHVARFFIEYGDPSAPVLDVGAGTGLVADCLNGNRSVTMDALDISKAMLDKAAAKGLYRKTIVADLTKPLDLADESYGAVVSAGTFTHGHVGPDALDELLRIAKRDALFVISVNSKHYVSQGFEAKFQTLKPTITDFSMRTVPIYSNHSDPNHKNDEGHIVVFRKA